MRDGARTTGAALEAHYRFVLWLVPAVERFPRSQKFLLGDRIQTTAMDVLEQLVEATYTRQHERHRGVHADNSTERPGERRAFRDGHVENRVPPLLPRSAREGQPHRKRAAATAAGHWMNMRRD